MKDAVAILVHESTPYWTPELQRQFVDDRREVVIRSCTPIAELDRLRQDYAATVIVFDATLNPMDCLSWLSARAGEDPVMVLASQPLAEWEWLFRSAGATSFCTDPITGRELARQCRRWLNAISTPRVVPREVGCYNSIAPSVTSTEPLE